MENKNDKKSTSSNAGKKQDLIIKVGSKFKQNSGVKNSEYVIFGQKIAIFYIESLIDKNLFSSGILKPLEKLKQQSKDGDPASNNQNLSEILKNEIVSVSSVEESADEDTIVEKILSGYAALVLQDNAICCPIFGAEKRGIEEPPNSRVIKGPREGFVEDIYTNIGLVRKRLKSVDLCVEDLFVGERTHTQVSIFYLDGIAKPEVVDEVKQRIQKIDIDGIIDSYYIESFLETDKIKFFRRVGNTEKPDVFCAKVLEGRVGILVDGSPISLTVPFVLFEDLQSAEDYYTLPAKATFVRIMRIFGLIFSILIPGIYIALQSFNYRILPVNFLISLLSSIEALSIPPLVEILLVLFLFEIITEASLQMPNQLGMALSIIGALALGNTAVDAGIISPPSIVIVAISSTALYIIPDQISETRLLRVLFTVIGGLLGLYGIIIGFIILSAYLSSITSFGVPYMVPLAPSVRQDKKDAFVKQSIQDMKTRPVFIAGENKVRQSDYFKDKAGSTKEEQNGEKSNSKSEQNTNGEQNEDKPNFKSKQGTKEEK